MRTFFAMLGGAAIGAGSALLFAPASGRRTRSLIRDKAVKYSNDVQDYVGSKSRHLANKMKGYRHKAEELQHRGEEVMHRGEEILHRGQEAVDKAKSAIRESRSEPTTTSV